MIPFIGHFRISKFYNNRKKISGCLGLRVGLCKRNWDVILYRRSLEGDENILKLIVVVVTQLCEHT